jgi:hypothetical protein
MKKCTSEGGGVAQLVECPPRELKVGGLKHQMDRHFFAEKNKPGHGFLDL